MFFRVSSTKTLLPALAMGVVSLAAIPVVSAGTLKLEHSVYLGGLYMGGVRTAIEEKGSSYEMFSKATTNKSLDWMFKWVAEGQSTGKFNGISITPSSHYHQSAWNKKKRGATLSYKADGTVEADLVGKKYTDLKKYTPVEPEMTKNSMDPMSMILAAFKKVQSGQGCTGTYPVYDGRRRYDVLLQDAGRKTFKKSRYSVFSGEASGCRIEMKQIGGFKRKPDYQLPEGSELVIWSASPVEDGQAVPVRMQVLTDLGTMELHLERYSDGTVSLASKTAD